MSNRKRLDRERLEYYLTYAILAYRRLIFVTSLLLLIYVVAAMSINLPGSIMTLILTIYLLLLSNSYSMTVYTARTGAWIGILWRQDE
jgi:hypothetical protein